MRVTNWGLFLLGIYLILAGLGSMRIFLLGQYTGFLGLVAGVLILMDNWRS